MNWTIIKEHLVSSGFTFLGVFISVLAIGIVNAQQIEWTSTFWGGLLISAVTAGIRELVIRYLPETSIKLGAKR